MRTCNGIKQLSNSLLDNFLIELGHSLVQLIPAHGHNNDPMEHLWDHYPIYVTDFVQRLLHKCQRDLIYPFPPVRPLPLA